MVIIYSEGLFPQVKLTSDPGSFLFEWLCLFASVPSNDLLLKPMSEGHLHCLGTLWPELCRGLELGCAGDVAS